MLEITFKGESYFIKNKVSELTVDEFNFIIDAYNIHRLNVDKWVSIISYLSGIESNEILNMSQDNFQLLINQMFINGEEVEPVKFIEFNGKKLTPIQELTIGGISKLEKLYIKNPKDSVSRALAVIFGYDVDHEDHIALSNYIKDLPINSLLPHFNKIVGKYTNYINSNQLFKDELNLESVH